MWNRCDKPHRYTSGTWTGLKVLRVLVNRPRAIHLEQRYWLENSRSWRAGVPITSFLYMTLGSTFRCWCPSNAWTLHPIWYIFMVRAEKRYRRVYVAWILFGRKNNHWRWLLAVSVRNKNARDDFSRPLAHFGRLCGTWRNDPIKCAASLSWNCLRRRNEDRRMRSQVEQI